MLFMRTVVVTWPVGEGCGWSAILCCNIQRLDGDSIVHISQLFALEIFYSDSSYDSLRRSSNIYCDTGNRNENPLNRKAIAQSVKLRTTVDVCL
jgi:hypothetical protein